MAGSGGWTRSGGGTTRRTGANSIDARRQRKRAAPRPALAARHLAAHGLRVIARNMRCRSGGEVDLNASTAATSSSSRCACAATAASAAPRRASPRPSSAARLIADAVVAGGAGRHFRQCDACRFDAVLLDASTRRVQLAGRLRCRLRARARLAAPADAICHMNLIDRISHQFEDNMRASLKALESFRHADRQRGRG